MNQFSNKKENNIAYIDGQNLYLATTKHPDLPWEVDLARLRVYLREKYNVGEAHYCLGYPDAMYNDLYEKIQKAGFILKFREHHPSMISKKKGNVDTEIIFEVMLRLYRNESFNGIILVSGDGDYHRLVRFLIEEKKLVKLLFPDKSRASSLYYSIDRMYYDDLSKPAIQAKIGRQKKKGSA
ncbi:NYN domain-containing protein [Candidatus Parcubacteria bacterium]|nr:MAG: NYN domain-containing protein [Candidatus Parcubacteria bacterium]